MNRLRALTALLVAAAACTFSPDLSRYQPCEEGACPEGFNCWPAEQVCVPICGEQADCDAGIAEDAGESDGGDAGANDGGVGDGGADAGPLRLDGGAMLRGVETEPYSWRFEAFGGSPPYYFAIVDGGLPEPMVLSASGQITGTPASESSSTFELRVIDQRSGSSSALMQWPVRPLLRIGSRPALQDALLNKPYDEPLYATGGVPPYQWELDGGSLPAGLQLSAAGRITGTSTANGTATFNVKLRDSDVPPQERTRQFTIVTKGTPALATWLTNALADGRADTPYEQTLHAAGGTAPLTFSVQSGSLPPGLALTGSNNDTVSGTPTDAGTYDFTLHVQDSTLQSANQALQIIVY